MLRKAKLLVDKYNGIRPKDSGHASGCDTKSKLAIIIKKLQIHAGK